MTTLTTQQHRRRGRDRTAFWVATTGVALVALIWAAPRREGQRGRNDEPHRHQGQSLTSLATELRQGGAHLAAAGLTEAQAGQLADLLEQHAPAFARLEAGAASLRSRAADLLAADTLDRSAVDELQAETSRLAQATIDETFDLLREAGPSFDASQRQHLLQHWTER